MKLTKELRHAIIASILAEKFQSIAADLKVEEHALADRIYTWAIGSHLKTIMSLPEGFFISQSQLRVDVASSPAEMKLPAYQRPSGRHYVYCTSPVRQPKNMSEGVDVGWNHPIAVELKALAEKNTALNKSKNQLNEALNEAFAQVTTDVRLIEMMPEIEAHVRKICQDKDTGRALAVSFKRAKDLLAGRPVAVEIEGE